MTFALEHIFGTKVGHLLLLISVREPHPCDTQFRKNIGDEVAI